MRFLINTAIYCNTPEGFRYSSGVLFCMSPDQTVIMILFIRDDGNSAGDGIFLDAVKMDYALVGAAAEM